MAPRGNVLELVDFSGGRNSFDPPFNVPYNQAIDLQNINLLDRGFEKRRGNEEFNASAMVGNTTAIVGAGYMKFNSGTEFLNAIAGTKFFTSSGLTGTMADKTGAVTITAGQNNLWTPVRFGNLQIWFGGAPDAPFKHDGTAGNAAALGGSPPSARTAFQANNRVFAISTSANPSRIYWCVLLNAEDWTGTGSGSADVSMNDGEELLTGIPLNADMAILFKNSSTHLMTLSKAPFSIYQLQKGIGACGRNAVVNANGVIYFITPDRQMKSTTDGRNFQDYPTAINDLWNTLTPSRLQYIQGIYYATLDQIHFICTTGSNTKNTISIIWDLRRKAWLYNPTGFGANVACLVQERLLYTGHYDGKLYLQDADNVYTDDSESGSGIIDAYWQTPWMRTKGLSGVTHPNWIDVSAQSEASSSLQICYGFDFAANTVCQNVSLQVLAAQWDVDEWDEAMWAGQTATFQRVYVQGRGNVFSVRIRNAVASQGFKFQAAVLQMRASRARKLLAVP